MDALQTPDVSLYKPKVAAKFKFEFVQVARGFAAIGVVLYHCSKATADTFHVTSLGGIYNLGLFGVDFFFVLSGFIITYMHLNDLRKGSNYQSFLKKRFIRILPIYWVVAVVTFLYLLLVQKGIQAHTGYVLNLQSVSGWIYLLKSILLFPQKIVGLVDVSWTLSFEMLFYLVFAFCIKQGWKTAKFVFFTWIACIIINSAGLTATRNYYINFLLSTNILEFLSGCLLAYLFKSRKIKLTLPLFTLLALVIGFASFIYLKLLHNQLSRTLTDMYFIIGASCLLLWGSATLDTVRKKGAFAPPKHLLLLGDASYSIYLTHTLIMDAVYVLLSGYFISHNIILNKPLVILLFFLIAAITVLAGVACHVYIERPLFAFIGRRYFAERGATLKIVP